MAAICGIVTAAIFQLLIGLVSTAFAGYTVATVYSSYQGDVENYILLISFQTLWMSLIAFGLTTLFAGIIGCVAGCQRGQCVVLTYMASCVLCCLSSCEVIAIGALYVINRCINGKDCMKGVFGIFWIVILACSAFVFLISLIGSGFACRARCYCCSSPGLQNIGEAHDPNLMVLTTTPTAPTLGQINSGNQY